MASIYAGHSAWGQGATNACAIVGDDGQYRLEIWPGGNPSSKNTKIYNGFLSPEILRQLKDMVRSPDLVKMGTVLPTKKVRVRSQVEIVALHVHRAGTVQEIAIVNPDGTHPIPDAVKQLEQWLERLAKNPGTQVADAEPRQCQGLDFFPGFTPRLQRR